MVIKSSYSINPEGIYSMLVRWKLMHSSISQSINIPKRKRCVLRVIGSKQKWKQCVPLLTAGQNHCHNGVVHTQIQAYHAPPAIGGYCVHDRLQAEGMMRFITHVTHQHFAIIAWVPTNQMKKSKKQKSRLKIDSRYRVRGFCKFQANKTFWPI